MNPSKRSFSVMASGVALGFLVLATGVPAAESQRPLVTSPKADPESPVTVRFDDPDGFRDVTDRGYLTRASSRVLASLTGAFEKAGAEVLEPGQSLEIIVTEVDLAGEYQMLRYTGGHLVRVHREVTWPRIEFSYRVLEGGSEVSSGIAEVDDKNYLHNLRVRAQHPTDSIPYEKAMLERWFAEAFDRAA